MTRREPRVSVGLPVYNGELFLRAAIESLLAQTHENFELIISDNASSDATADICRGYATRDRRIQYHRQDENRGAAWNFNYTFHQSRGTYFKWAASDDICAPTYLGRCVELLDTRADVVWCHSRCTHITPDGQPIIGPGLSDVSYIAPTPVEDAPNATREPITRASTRASERLRAVVLSTSNMDVFGLVRRSAMKSTGLQRPYYGADKVFVAELALIGPYAELPETLFFNRVHAGASGALATVKQQQHWIAPGSSRRFDTTRAHLFKSYLRAVMHAELSPLERIRCLQVLAQYLFQVNKWGRVIARTLAGRGTGGGYLDHLQQIETKRKSTDVAHDAETYPAARSAN